MIRSPSSASAISNARSWSGGMISASTGPCAWASTRAGRPASCASSPMNAPGPCVTIGSAAARLVVLGDVDLAGQDDGQAGADLADFRQRLARTIGADLAKAAHALDLRRLQNREHLVASRVDDR